MEPSNADQPVDRIYQAEAAWLVAMFPATTSIVTLPLISLTAFTTFMLCHGLAQQGVYACLDKHHGAVEVEWSHGSGNAGLSFASRLARGIAFSRMSRIVMMPTRRPSSSTTGRRSTLFAYIVSAAFAVMPPKP